MSSCGYGNCICDKMQQFISTLFHIHPVGDAIFQRMRPVNIHSCHCPPSEPLQRQSSKPIPCQSHGSMKDHVSNCFSWSCLPLRPYVLSRQACEVARGSLASALSASALSFHSRRPGASACVHAEDQLLGLSAAVASIMMLPGAWG